MSDRNTEITKEHRGAAVEIVLGDLKKLYNTLQPDSSVLVIGGHAISSYLPQGQFRLTADVDILSNIIGAPKAAKANLLANFPERYTSPTDALFVKLGGGAPDIQVDILDIDMFKNDLKFPISLKLLQDLAAGHEVDFYATPFDLVVAKMFSAPIRSAAKSVTDVGDLVKLLEVIWQNGGAPPESHKLWVQATLEIEKQTSPTAPMFEHIEADLLAIFGPGSEETQEGNDAA